MQAELVPRPALSLVGLEIRTSNANAHEIGALWGRFLGENLPERIAERTDASIVAVYCEYEGDHTRPYTFFLGCPVAVGASAPEGLSKRDVPGGTFAHLASVGEQPQTLMRTWGEIWDAGLDRAFDVDYEVHGADARRVDVYVGVNPPGS